VPHDDARSAARSRGAGGAQVRAAARPLCGTRSFPTLAFLGHCRRYDEDMKRRLIGFVGNLILLAAFCSGQIRRPANPSEHVEIKLPPEVNSEAFFARYVLAGQDFGGWVRPFPGISSYGIGTTIEGRPATGIKAILYAPGCAIQTLDLRLSVSDNPQFPFICQPMRNIGIQGALIRSERLYGHKVKLQAKYIARWAQPFLGLDESIVTGIPIGDGAHLSADGRFRLVIPDLSQDPLAGAPDHPGEIQVWAKDETSDALVAKLIPADPQFIKTRMGGLKVRSEYPSEIVFAPCATRSAQGHDRIGFAMRPDIGDACDP
jgi:hypothetical protein